MKRSFPRYAFLAAALWISITAIGGAVSPNVVVSQVYGGGGNAGATYTHDYIELFNRGSEPAPFSREQVRERKRGARRPAGPGPCWGGACVPRCRLMSPALPRGRERASTGGTVGVPSVGCELVVPSVQRSAPFRYQMNRRRRMRIRLD